MAGHSKWKQIKNKKAATDQKRGALFSKLLATIRVAAKADPNPDFNPRLKAAIAKAKSENVPQDNIERAIAQAKEGETEELIIEAYGPGGAAMIITSLTQNKNRTVAEVKNILSGFNAKMAEPGSVLWAFEKDEGGGWLPKFPQSLGEQPRGALRELIESLEDREDIIKVYTNADENLGH